MAVTRRGETSDRKPVFLVVFAVVAALTLAVGCSDPQEPVDHVLVRGQVAWDDDEPAQEVVIAAMLRLPQNARTDVPAGQPIGTHPVGEFVTPSDGVFQFVLDPADVPAQYQGEEGTVDVTVVLSSGSQFLGSYNLSLSRSRSPAGPWWTDRENDGTTPGEAKAKTLTLILSRDGGPLRVIDMGDTPDDE